MDGVTNKGIWFAFHHSSRVNLKSYFCLDNHISMCCHLRRGNISSGDSSRSNYELVIFSGYYRFQGNHESKSLGAKIWDATYLALTTDARVQPSWEEDGKDGDSYEDSLTKYNG